MTFWTVQDAKAHFTEFLEQTLKDGPQIVTRDGVEVAVFVSSREWRQLEDPKPPNLKELLLQPTPRMDDFPLPRRSPKSRTRFT